MANTDSLEQYLLLLLSDSNLPTGGFIASSGLESFIQHGLLSTSTPSQKSDAILSFIRRSLNACAHLNLPFVSSSHHSLVQSSSKNDEKLERLVQLDRELEAMTLNHVARRASTAQGIALLTLYERAFAPELNSNQGELVESRELIEKYKGNIRKGDAFGHFPIGFGVLTASLGLSLKSSQHLFLFLHCRSLLSSAIRMNAIGPYLSHRLLLHDVRPLVDQTLEKYHDLRAENEGKADHEDDGEDQVAMTWPLGEILQARHDSLHSKIFNS